MANMKEILGKLNKFSNNLSLRGSVSWRRRSNLYLMVFFVFIFLFLFFNIYFSQQISPLFFGLVNNNRKSAVEFLQKIRNASDFDQQLRYYENIYGQSIKTEVFAKELQREMKIKQFEQILISNSQAKDVLYSLYLLYKEKGNYLTAEKYLRLVKEVDPDIK